jgi:hypothetical protein
MNKRPKPKPTPYPAPEITASEINEWLRTLPPLPLHGEAQ